MKPNKHPRSRGDVEVDMVDDNDKSPAALARKAKGKYKNVKSKSEEWARVSSEKSKELSSVSGGVF